MRLRWLHRRLGALLALSAIAAFVSGAGLDAPSIIPAAVLLLVALVANVPEQVRARAELGWRVLATLLALRAAYHALFVPTDVVLPMVDLLLLLVLAEVYRVQDAVGEARLYALTFALLIASAAYRPGFAFALAYLAYIAILTVALIVGQLARRARELHAPEPRLPRGFLRHSAAASLVVLLVSALVFLAFPRVSRAWATRGAPPVRNVMGFSDRISLLDHGGQLYANPEVVMRVEFPDGAPPSDRLYFRGRSYDYFDGWTWSRSPYLPSALIEPAGWPPGRIEQLIYQRDLGQTDVLFGLSPVTRVEPRSRIAPFRESNGDYRYGGSAEPVYRAVSVAGEPHPDVLRAATGDAPRAIGAYRRLPPLSPRLRALADSLTRGQDNDYDRVLAVRDWLRSSVFRYTVELPATEREAALEHFLFERRAGHCEYFSTAMAVLLRAAGVPARNVNGFLGGDWNEFGDYLTVTQNQAHSWVEVWFPGFGWVLFDPTPTGAGGSAAAARQWWAPFRFLVDGLEHRWGKWVLDFDLDTQASLARRATEAFQAEPGTGRAPLRPRLHLLLGAVALLLGAALWRRRHRGGRARRAPAHAAARSYLRLRRAYARRGWGEPHLPPFHFAVLLERGQAPGAADAAAAARLYAAARFGGVDPGPEARQALERHSRAALAALRATGRGGAP